MRKPSEGTVAIGALIAFALWVFVALPFLYSVPRYDSGHNQATEQAADSSGSPHKAKESFWERATDDPVAVFTLALVVFTFVLAVSTIGLWVVTWLAASTQAKDTRVLQRAYIAVGGGGISPLGTLSVAHIEVKNMGNLPAREVSWFIAHAIDTDGRRSNFPIDESLFYGRNALPPGTEMKRSQNCILDQQDIMALGDTEELVSFYVWGEVRYLDGFDRRRFTRFCHRYNNRCLIQTTAELFPGSAPMVSGQAISAESMRYHQFGNDSD